MDQNFRKLARSWFLFVGFFVLAGCNGCGTRDSENGRAESLANPYAGLTMHVAVPAGRNLLSDWQLAMSEWSAQHGAECRLREYPLPDDFAEFPAVLKQASQKGDDRPEVMLIPWSAVPELMAQDALAEIPEAVQRQEQLNWLGFFPGLRNRAAKVARKPRLVPVSCPVLVCYYRQDLLEQAGLSPPKTWSEYQTLLETLEEWAPGLTAVEPWSESFRATMFLARSAAVAKHPEQFSFCFALRNGEPLIENPGFVTSLKMAKAALAHMPSDVQTYSPGDCRREILAGRAALAIGYETDRGLEATRGETVQIGISQLPGTTRVYNTAVEKWVDFDENSIHRVTLTGFAGWALAVSANLDSTRNRAAWELTRYMAVDQLPISYPASMVSPCRDSHTASPSTWTGPQWTTSEAEQYVAVVADALRSDQLVMEFPLIGQTQFRAALTEGLSQALGPEGNEEAILKSVAEAWREISEKLGKENVAKSYQRSHE